MCDQIRTEAEAERCAEDGYNCVLCRPRDVPPPHLLPPPPPPKPPTPTKSPGNRSGYSGMQYDILNRSMHRLSVNLNQYEVGDGLRQKVSEYEVKQKTRLPLINRNQPGNDKERQEFNGR